MSTSSYTLNIVQTDTLPLLRVQLKSEGTGLPVSLVGVAITGSIRVREYGAEESLFDADLEKVDGGVYGWMKVAEWPADAFDLDPGIYEGQITVVLGSGTKTITRKIRVRIHEKFKEPA